MAMNKNIGELLHHVLQAAVARMEDDPSFRDQVRKGAYFVHCALCGSAGNRPVSADFYRQHPTTMAQKVILFVAQPGDRNLADLYERIDQFLADF